MVKSRLGCRLHGSVIARKQMRFTGLSKLLSGLRYDWRASAFEMTEPDDECSKNFFFYRHVQVFLLVSSQKLRGIKDELMLLFFFVLASILVR